MTLTPASAADLNAVTTLLSLAFADYARGLGRDKPGPYDWLPGRIDQGDVWLSHGPEGLCGVVIVADLPDVATLAVDMLAIDPTHQGKGVGSRMLDAIEARAVAAGCDAVTLRTAQAYTHLIALYSRRGYRVTGLGAVSNGDPHLRVTMALPLRNLDTAI